MPVTYTFRCPSCKATFDARCKMGETTRLCEKCGKAVAHSIICAPVLSLKRKTGGKGRN